MKKTKVKMINDVMGKWDANEFGLVDGYIMDNGVLNVVVVLGDRITLCLADDLIVL